MSPQPVIYWFRRDLRLQDNLAFHAALTSGSPVIPLFVFDPSILRSSRSGSPRMAFLLKALAALDQSLRAVGAALIIKHGSPLEVLANMVREQNAAALYFNRDYSPFAVRRDQAIRDVLSVPVHVSDDAVLLPPEQVLKGDGSPYTVYTPYKNAWRKLPKPEIVKSEFRGEQFYAAPDLMSDDLPTLRSLGFSESVPLPPASETVAANRLSVFVAEDIFNYADGRNRLLVQPFSEAASGGSSALSPYFRLGLLSPRQAYWAARDAYARAHNDADRESVTTWVDELIWREFYMQILAHFPHTEKENFKRQYDDVAWRHAPDELATWKAGMTGYPIVDAAMRQLMQIGWMPNRARMIVASFLTKDLLIHWHEGELHFMQWLIDGDPAANNGGWQWAAGTGTDAQPYFRIFNPVAQSEKFDPTGAYIRYWLPELRDLPLKQLYAPWRSPSPVKNYPAPMVDHAQARERTLAAFKMVRG